MYRIFDFIYEEFFVCMDEYLYGSDGDVFKDNKIKGGIILRKVEDKDFNKDCDKNQLLIKELSIGKKKIKELFLFKNIC